MLPVSYFWINTVHGRYIFGYNENKLTVLLILVNSPLLRFSIAPSCFLSVGTKWELKLSKRNKGSHAKLCEGSSHLCNGTVTPRCVLVQIRKHLACNDPLGQPLPRLNRKVESQYILGHLFLFGFSVRLYSFICSNEPRNSTRGFKLNTHIFLRK